MTIVANTGAAPRPRRAGATARRGLTLIETALATIIVGVAVLALVSAQQVFHQKNAWSTYATIGMQLANEIREMTLNLPNHDPVTGTEHWGPEEETEFFIGDFDDVDDFDGAGGGFIFAAADGSGPINARREIIANMAGWEQEVSVRNVNPYDITATGIADGSTNTLLVEVIVRFTDPGTGDVEEVTRVSWIAPN